MRDKSCRDAVHRNIVPGIRLLLSNDTCKNLGVVVLMKSTTISLRRVLGVMYPTYIDEIAATVTLTLLGHHVFRPTFCGGIMIQQDGSEMRVMDQTFIVVVVPFSVKTTLAVGMGDVKEPAGVASIEVEVAAVVFAKTVPRTVNKV